MLCDLVGACGLQFPFLKKEKIFIYLFIYLVAPGLVAVCGIFGCSIQDLSSLTIALEAWSLNSWTAREFLPVS